MSIHRQCCGLDVGVGEIVYNNSQSRRRKAVCLNGAMWKKNKTTPSNGGEKETAHFNGSRIAQLLLPHGRQMNDGQSHHHHLPHRCVYIPLTLSLLLLILQRAKNCFIPCRLFVVARLCFLIIVVLFRFILLSFFFFVHVMDFVVAK